MPEVVMEFGGAGTPCHDLPSLCSGPALLSPLGHVWPGWALLQLPGGCRAGSRGPVGLEMINPPHLKPNPSWQLLLHQGQRPLAHLPQESGQNSSEKLLLLGD